MTDQDPIDARSYSAFVGQIEIVNLWLHTCTVKNHVGPGPDRAAEIRVHDNARWSTNPIGFVVTHEYQLIFGPEGAPDDQAEAEIRVSFGIAYASELPMDDKTFEVFAKNNLRLNTWPYAREFVSTTVGRMGWLATTLPAFKIGGPDVEIGEPEPAETPKKKPTARKRSKPSEVSDS